MLESLRHIGGPRHPRPPLAENNQMRRTIQIFLAIAFVVWVVEWFWWFGFSFSSRTFQQPNWRLLSLFLEMLAIAVPPLSSYWVVLRTMERRESEIRAFVANLVVSGLPVFSHWAFYETWVHAARKSGQIYISAGSAMGIGVIGLFCFFVFLIANLAVVCFLLVYALLGRTKPETR